MCIGPFGAVGRKIKWKMPNVKEGMYMQRDLPPIGELGGKKSNVFKKGNTVKLF